MKYVFVLYNYDSNAPLSKPMKLNKGSAIIAAYNSIYNELIDTSIIPILQYLNNEVSKKLIQSIKAKNFRYQLAAPHDHRLNPAERAIQTFKNHLLKYIEAE